MLLKNIVLKFFGGDWKQQSPANGQAIWGRCGYFLGWLAYFMKNS